MRDWVESLYAAWGWESWSPATHHRFPERSRALAASLFRLGYELAGEYPGIQDLWLHIAAGRPAGRPSLAPPLRKYGL